MRESASDASRRMISARIIQNAQDLAEARGLDGFTMEDLAEAAGVSRRTLFNYVDGKLDAVLGAPGDPDPARLLAFRQGGPTGRLGDDILATIISLLDAKTIASEDLDRTRRLIAAEPRLAREMHGKFAQIARFFAEAIQEREGARCTPLQARAAATVMLSLFDLALDAYVADPSKGIAAHYLESFEGVAAMFK